MPVKTAKELFRLSYYCRKCNEDSEVEGEDLRTVVDVIDQSITVLTQQNVETEERDADLLLVPDIKENAAF